MSQFDTFHDITGKFAMLSGAMNPEIRSRTFSSIGQFILIPMSICTTQFLFSFSYVVNELLNSRHWKDHFKNDLRSDQDHNINWLADVPDREKINL
jgi:hypothetical protein